MESYPAEWSAIDVRLEWVICLLLVAAPVASEFLRPVRMQADESAVLNLELLIPKQFGDWTFDRMMVPISPAPDVQQKLDETYTQILGRTYMNRSGYRVMLSIAYGADQSSDATSVHRPEFCYVAQGFQLAKINDGVIRVSGDTLPVRRLIAERSFRNEPITYWVMLGTNTTLPGLRRKLDQLKSGLRGVVPDGMLIRISSIDLSEKSAFDMHEDFAAQLANSLPVSARPRIFGAQ